MEKSNCLRRRLLALLCHVASGQTPSQNYVRESILLDKFTSDPCTDYDFARNTVTYYDGLGRQVQTVKVGAGWNVFDIHTITEYDSNARFRDAVLAGSFYQQDPLAEKYYSFSPYHYSACNPIKLVDWSGMDIWEFNPGGYLAFHQKTDDNVDQLNMVDNLGKPIYKDGIPVTLSLEGSPIERHYVWKGENGAQCDFMRVRGDDNAKAIFEFLSEHITGSETMVEMGWAKTGIEGDKGLNFISTGHKKRAEPGLSYLYDRQLKNGYTIRESIHSHPKTNYASNADLQVQGWITKKQQKYGLPVPRFSIYFVPTREYVPFNK